MGCKPINKLVVYCQKMSVHMGDPLSDPTKYIEVLLGPYNI